MINDWAKPSIKLDQLHKRLDDCLNMKKHSEAFSILLEMQGEVLKLQQFVLYGGQKVTQHTTIGRSVVSKLQPTMGEVALEKAQNLARFAVERANAKDWTEHPMFGIAVDKDKWAVKYQKELDELANILTHKR